MNKHILLAICLFAAAANARADGTINLAEPENGNGWVISDYQIRITADGTYKITGRTTLYHILISPNVTASLILQNAVIIPPDAPAIALSSDAMSGSNVTLISEGNDSLIATDPLCPAIQVESNQQLIISANTPDNTPALITNTPTFLPAITAPLANPAIPPTANATNFATSPANFANIPTFPPAITTPLANIPPPFAFADNDNPDSDSDSLDTITPPLTLVIQGASGNATGSPAIGSSAGNTAGYIYITAGRTIATGGYHAPAIGASPNATTGYISISGGQLIATGGTGAAAIGSGSEGINTGTIAISGGIITATGGTSAAAIGGGTNTDGGTISITGGSITATGGSNASAIGGGFGTDAGSGTLHISGGTLLALSDNTADGIGCSNLGNNSGSITISGGTLLTNAIAMNGTPLSISGANTLILSTSLPTQNFGDATVLTGDAFALNYPIVAGDNQTDLTLLSPLTLKGNAILSVPPGIRVDFGNYLSNLNSDRHIIIGSQFATHALALHDTTRLTTYDTIYLTASNPSDNIPIVHDTLQMSVRDTLSILVRDTFYTDHNGYIIQHDTLYLTYPDTLYVEQYIWYDTLTLVQTLRDTFEIIRQIKDTVVKEVEIIKDILVYVVIDKTTGATHVLDWDTRVTTNGNDIQITNLTPNAPLYIYTIRGIPYANGRADDTGTYLLPSPPPGLYILEHAAHYSKFTH